ncbi:ABC transporter ATP-binding protein [Williamsia sterculiae]|uniref:ABC-type quaternary amine transporter n=1 Tax=Williamsia sterculiae TaxID=1344003 RepID=A0A1N7FS38_9NOCA|nr:ABC transporter ATP-binding protein [Williamsia sterculiae]SIS03130.1 thiamine transport system ATP-binding protein [Williamsia sterculiae]
MAERNGLDIDGVRVDYGSQTVLHDLTLHVPVGVPATGAASATALLGPSGCGKSTLIRAIAGLETLHTGRIRFDGQDVSRVPPHRRDFGVVFQTGQLFESQTVSRNIAYGLRARRWSRRDIAARVDELLTLTRLTVLRDRPATALSGGQAQRVALARALAPRPRLLLLDEPLSALDRRLRDELAAEIRDILQATGTPTVLVTHDHSEAAAMADRIAVMRDGGIVQVLPPDELWRRPRDPWVAEFLGCTAIVDADVRDGLATTRFGALPVDRADGPVQLGLRPESLRVVAASGADPAGVLAEVIRVVSLPTGFRLRVRLVGVGATDGAGECTEVDAVADGPVGARVRVGLDAERVAVIGG